MTQNVGEVLLPAAPSHDLETLLSERAAQLRSIERRNSPISQQTPAATFWSGTAVRAGWPLGCDGGRTVETRRF
jgi:hypothetical protein